MSTWKEGGEGAKIFGQNRTLTGKNHTNVWTKGEEMGQNPKFFWTSFMDDALGDIIYMKVNLWLTSNFVIIYLGDLTWIFFLQRFRSKL